MSEHFRYAWQLLTIATVILIAGILSISLAGPWISPWELTITVALFTLVNLVSYLIIVRGTKRDVGGQLVFTMAGMGVKFLLYLLYLLVFWLVTKNLTKAFVLTFFALYLVFSLFLAGSLLKYLKNK